MAAFPTDEGAVVYETNTQPGNSGVVVSLNVLDSIEETLERVIAFGGNVLREKTKIEAENMGYFALFLDCEGNRLGSDADAQDGLTGSWFLRVCAPVLGSRLSKFCGI